MRVLQICGDYFGTTLYKILFKSLFNLGVTNKVCVNRKKRKNNIYEEQIYSFDVYKFKAIFQKSILRKAKKKIEKAIDLNNIDVAHAHYAWWDGYVAYLLYKQYDIPYIVAVRNSDINGILSMPFYKHLYKDFVKVIINASKVVCLSNPYKDKLLNKMPQEIQPELEKRIIVIPNGIDSFYLNNIYKRSGLDENNIKILSVCEINENKNVLSTVKAIKMLLEEGMNITFTLIGKVKDENIFKEIKKDEFVNYLEPLQKEKLIEIYRENDIFVMPSITETFGLVYAEAMSQGLPVIYSKGQGFDKQFEDGHVGYPVEAKSISEIKQGLEKIIENYDELSKNCINSVEVFNWRSIAEKYLNIYKK